MKRYSWLHPAKGWQTVECDRLEVRDNRVDFIGPDGNYLSIHNDDVRLIEREL